MAFHRGRGMQFGGVHDVEASEEGIDSEFFNTLFVWNIERNRFFSLGLRRPKMGQKKNMQTVERGRRERGKAAEEDLLKNLAALEMKGGVSDIEAVASPVAKEEVQDGEPMPEKPVLWEMPHPRFNAQLAVQNDVLFIFGGTYEKGDREFTFEDMYAIDLDKLDGVKEMYRREPEDWQGSESEDSEDDEDETDGEDSAEEDEDEKAAQVARLSKRTGPTVDDKKVAETASAEAVESEAMAESDQQTSSLDDSLPHPRPFESLRDFYARTSSQWQQVLLQENESADASSNKSVKEMRKGAFERAEEKWWDCREEIRALEDEQEEAGIAEVVSLADKTAADGAGGAGRRR